MVSQLLYELPAGERYRILFMERDLEEMLVSQEKMLQRLGRPALPRDQMKQAYTVHLERLHSWLARQSHMAVLRLRYNNLVEQPREQAERVRQFLERTMDVDAMIQVVDTTLYRNRKPSAFAAEQPGRGHGPGVAAE